MDKRRFTRVPFVVSATVTRGEISFTGEVVDLSLNGMFVKTEEQPAIGEEVEVVISLAEGSPSLNVELAGEVVRADASGVAIRFSRIEVDSFIHLRNIVEYNTPEPTRVMDEFADYVEDRLGRK
ncbi:MULTISPECIES: PilZ domain-containing protein [Geobacter]|uniref:Pilus assembly protein PilZ n=2 Tax=Geobacter TaxID=28231 RepID=A0A0C1TTG4_9BACT|nr:MULTISPECIES: PilZ domain-containing protein [Geobacter]ANA40700.1 pilus assembly protein PilZ [Geobacter anodireducens]KIE42768.1 pilus assembly protein PilZ [Geobacter soli]MBE2888343.1 PilZ domain-containing protein [Geobacter anodireducens]HMN02701.1 PilZ domain-containing protein [Geobacter anodireducens]